MSTLYLKFKTFMVCLFAFFGTIENSTALTIKVERFERIRPETKQIQTVYLLGDLHETSYTSEERRTMGLISQDHFLSRFKGQDLSDVLVIAEDMKSEYLYSDSSMLFPGTSDPMRLSLGYSEVGYIFLGGIAKRLSDMYPQLEIFNSECRHFLGLFLDPFVRVRIGGSCLSTVVKEIEGNLVAKMSSAFLKEWSSKKLLPYHDIPWLEDSRLAGELFKFNDSVPMTPGELLPERGAALLDIRILDKIMKTHKSKIIVLSGLVHNETISTVLSSLGFYSTGIDSRLPREYESPEKLAQIINGMESVLVSDAVSLLDRFFEVLFEENS